MENGKADILYEFVPGINTQTTRHRLSFTLSSIYFICRFVNLDVLLIFLKDNFMVVEKGAVGRYILFQNIKCGAHAFLLDKGVIRCVVIIIFGIVIGSGRGGIFERSGGFGLLHKFFEFFLILYFLHFFEDTLSRFF